MSDYALSDVDITYTDVCVYHGFRRMDELLAIKHPKQTVQIFDFNQNLFMHMEITK